MKNKVLTPKEINQLKEKVWLLIQAYQNDLNSIQTVNACVEEVNDEIEKFINEWL